MRAIILVDNNSRNALVPEWGLSVWIEYCGHKILLDAGASGVFADNAKALGLDLAEIDFGVLSHAHYDHADGLARFFAENHHAPFYIRQGSGENCYGFKDGAYEYIGIHQGYLTGYRDRIRYVQGDLSPVPGVTLLPHKTPHLEEKGRRAGMFVKRGNCLCPDDFSHEQSLVLDTGAGLVLFNSCAHGGADNIIREAAATWPEKPIRALIGGLHLYESSEEEVRELARRVRETGIERLYTGHCTGEVAFQLLKEELGELVQPLYTGLVMEF